jgi:hypothetical protein
MGSTQQFLTAIERPRCPRCQRRMQLERTSAGPLGFEHRLFECLRSDRHKTEAIPLDPLKSKAVGWLAGELGRVVGANVEQLRSLSEGHLLN